jgi:hypothetical protein
MTSPRTRIRFGGFELTSSRHVCAFFNSTEEAYSTLMPFISDGFTCGHKAVHFVNPGSLGEHMNRLRCEGIDALSAVEDGQLDVRETTDVYLQDGRFDEDRMVHVFERLASLPDKPFPLSRIICQMDWATERKGDLRHVIEFESRINEVWQRHDDVVVCIYDAARLSGDAVVDIIRTHPVVVLGGRAHENPFYVPPAEFLENADPKRSEGRATTTDG